MRTIPLVLSAALLTFGGAAHATTRDVTDYLQRAGAAASAEAAAAGVQLDQDVRVKARVGSDGRLMGARVVGSSGSLEADQKTVKALRRLKVAGPPILLVGAEVTVTVSQDPVVQARNR